MNEAEGGAAKTERRSYAVECRKTASISHCSRQASEQDTASQESQARVYRPLGGRSQTYMYGNTDWRGLDW